jgi:hypothetical protein
MRDDLHPSTDQDEFVEQAPALSSPNQGWVYPKRKFMLAILRLRRQPSLQIMRPGSGTWGRSFCQPLQALKHLWTNYTIYPVQKNGIDKAAFANPMGVMPQTLMS